MVPDSVMEGLPHLKTERESACKEQQEERQMEMSRLRPPLTDRQLGTTDLERVFPGSRAGPVLGLLKKT